MSNIQFLSPLALWGFATIPLLWWLIRLTPPSPQQQSFPALILLRDLAPASQSPANTPWWLILLRLTLLSLLVLGLARPVIAPTAQLPGTGTITILVDNGWASGDSWPQWQTALNNLCQQAEREQRDLLIIPTAPEQRSGNLTPLGPTSAITLCPTLAKLQPHPWPVDHAATNQLLNKLPNNITWFNDGLASAATETLYAQLRKNNLTLYQPDHPPYLLQPNRDNTNTALAITVTRADTTASADILLTAQDKNGHTLGLGQGSFKPREKNLTITFDLPNDLRNQTTRLVLQDSHTAGGIYLLDTSAIRHPIGLIGDEVSQHAQPLLNGLHYLEHALEAHQQVTIGTVEDLIAQKVTLICNTNERALLSSTEPTLTNWVQQGGVLVQFAGAELASDSALLPTVLRQNRRDMGGIFSWEKPQSLTAFPKESPFAGLPIPPDVSINQQRLADPAGLTASNSWARLSDGTPLVTGKKMGRGMIVLFHIPASPGWSNLPLSGLFVQMLERLVTLSATGSVTTTSNSTLAPYLLLDGFGQLHTAEATALTPEAQKSYQASPEHPPGLYGTTNNNRAFNLGQSISNLTPFTPTESTQLTREQNTNELRPALLTLALILFLADLILVLSMQGLFRWSPAALLLALILTTPAHAATDETTALSEKIWLGHITNGAGERSMIAASGLTTLAERIRQKTAVEQIGVLPINLEQDDLSLVPFLYWPLTENPSLSPAAQQKLQDFFTHGGMLLIDLTSDPENNLTLRESGIPLPMLAPITAEHPALRTFYLLRDCPGENTSGAVWSERDVSTRQDNVPALFIGSRDWSSAWSHPSTRQEEMATRCGLNLVMYALTGNYKMDQVHVSSILERLNR